MKRKDKLHTLLQKAHEHNKRHAATIAPTWRKSVMAQIRQEETTSSYISLEFIAPKLAFGAAAFSLVLLCASVMLFNDIKLEIYAALSSQASGMTSLFWVSM